MVSSFPMTLFLPVFSVLIEEINCTFLFLSFAGAFLASIFTLAWLLELPLSLPLGPDVELLAELFLCPLEDPEVLSGSWTSTCFSFCVVFLAFLVSSVYEVYSRASTFMPIFLFFQQLLHIWLFKSSTLTQQTYLSGIQN
ncbi:Hypothetical_protein [Hexamita inflata]|uniref:Hypothetical_protein n=1 Tax=Hexamita inflata TaxID=28002 RepID=A0AA86Q7M2_9EUKA|nr:Hypothetical protein HINF_LOCUS38532 [Hexamita inflata]